MDAIRLRRRVFASGQPFGAGQTAVIDTDISRADAEQLVRIRAAEPAEAPAAEPRPARARPRRADTEG